MNCQEAPMLVEAYADGELDPLRGYAIERHLHGCADCAARHQRVLDVRTRVRAELPYFNASDSLRERVRVTLDAIAAAEPRRPKPRTRAWPWFTGGALAGFAATVLSWFLGTTLIAAVTDENLAVEAVATHVRATLDGQLIQIASSDQHTVKPWLSARLDYSPPVRDYATEGFTLVGGRIDTLQRHTVATLVYRYRLHTIDVYVTPEARHGVTLAPRIVRGFNVAYGTGSGMDWVAVSDVSPDVLSGFVHRLETSAVSP